MKCKSCNFEHLTETEKTFSNGTNHIELRCAKCGAFNGYKPRTIENPGDFVMPFGKHKNKTLKYISVSDPGYLTWCLGTLDRSGIKRRISEFLIGKNPEHISSIIPRLGHMLGAELIDYTEVSEDAK